MSKKFFDLKVPSDQGRLERMRNLNNNTIMERKTFKRIIARTALTIVMLTVPVLMMWGQETNKKFSMTTQMFLNKLQEQKEQQASGMRRAPVAGLPKPQRLIASPDTIGGVAYISCFINLSDPSDLSAEARSSCVSISPADISLMISSCLFVFMPYTPSRAL